MIRNTIMLISFLLSYNNAINFTELFSITQKLHNFHNFNNFLIFSNQRRSFNSNLSQVVQQIETNFTKPVVWIRNTPLRELRNILHRNTLSLIFLKDKDAAILSVVIKTLDKMLLSKMMFVFTTNDIDSTDVLELSGWCWDKYAINSIFVYENQCDKMEIFSFNPFPSISLSNLSLETNIKKFFPNKIENLKGYRLNVGIKFTPPRYFRYFNKEGREIIAGIAYMFLNEFIKRYNATFIETRLDFYYEYAEYTELIVSKKVDLGMYPIGFANHSAVDTSYPISSSTLCVVAPRINRVLPHVYVLLPFQNTLWYVIIITVILLIAIGHAIAVKLRCRFEFGDIFINIVQGLLYTRFLKYRVKYILFWRFYFGIVAIFGFIMTNLYLPLLTSYLAKTVYVRQLETIEDFIAHKCRILVSHSISQFMINSGSFPQEFLNLLDIADVNTLVAHQYALNHSYAYVLPTDVTDFILTQQSLLNKPVFTVTKICFGKRYVMFPMPFDSPFLEILDGLLKTIHRSGIISKWNKKIFEQARQGGILTIFKDYQNPMRKIDLDNLILVFSIYFFGIFVSCGCFLFEIIRYYIAMKKRK